MHFAFLKSFRRAWRYYYQLHTLVVFNKWVSPYKFLYKRERNINYLFAPGNFVASHGRSMANIEFSLRGRALPTYAAHVSPPSITHHHTSGSDVMTSGWGRCLFFTSLDFFSLLQEKSLTASVAPNISLITYYLWTILQNEQFQFHGFLSSCISRQEHHIWMCIYNSINAWQKQHVFHVLKSGYTTAHANDVIQIPKDLLRQSNQNSNGFTVREVEENHRPDPLLNWTFRTSPFTQKALPMPGSTQNPIIPDVIYCSSLGLTLQYSIIHRVFCTPGEVTADLINIHHF